MKYRTFSKLIFSICLSIFTFIDVYAQEVFVGKQELANNDGPVYIPANSKYTYSRSAFIFTKNELLENGAYAGLIRDISFYRNSPAGDVYQNSNSKFRIYFKPISFNSFDSSQKSWALLFNNSSLVYENLNQNFISTDGWQKFSFQNAFTWNGLDNILILIDFETPDTSNTSISWKVSNISNRFASRNFNSFNAMSTLFTDTYRPNTRFTFFGNYNNEAGITRIEKVKGVCSGNLIDVKCVLKNYGINTLQNVTLNWTLDNVLQTPIQLLVNLSTGVDSVINLAQINLNTNGRNVKVWTSSPNGVVDSNAINDTVVHQFLPALNGTYTISANGNYSSIVDAVKDLDERGICGNVNFNVLPQTIPYKGKISINNIVGLNSNNRIVFNGNSSVISDTLGFPTEGRNYELWQLNNVSFITIQNFDIQFYPTNTTNPAINLGDNTSNISVLDNKITHLTKGMGTGISFDIRKENGQTYRVVSNNNKIIGNEIKDPYVGILFNNYAIYTSDNLIENNKIINANLNGIDIRNAQNTIVRKNEIFWLNKNSKTSLSQITGIKVYDSVSNSIIEKNKIYNILGSSTVLNVTFRGIDISSPLARFNKKLKILNNLIYNFSETNGSSFGVYSVAFDSITFENNTIYATDQVGSSQATCLSINAGSGMLIRNNVLVNSKSSSSDKRVVLLQNNVTYTADNNLYYINAKGTGVNYILQTTSNNFSTLANWKTQSPLNNLNSVDVNPLFKDSIFDLRPLHPSATNAGVSTPNVIDDINGKARSFSTPDIGVYEYEVESIDASLSQINLIPNSCANPQVLKIKVKNQGVSTITNININWSVNAALQSSSIHNLNITQGKDTVVTLGNYSMFFGNTYQVKAWVNSVNNSTDLINDNDTTNATLIFNYYTDTIKVGGPNAHFQTISDAINGIKTNGLCSNLTIDVNPLFGPYNEQVNITNISGLSASHQLIINGNGSEIYFEKNSIDDAYVFRINGLSYVTIKNFNIRTSLTSNNGIGIHLANNSNYNTISNNKISTGKNTNVGKYYGIAFNNNNAGTFTAGNYKYNKIIGNEINGGYYSIVIIGSNITTGVNRGNEIKNNFISQFTGTAIRVLTCDSIIIESNEVHQKGLPISLLHTSIKVINIVSTNNNSSISNNYIHDIRMPSIPLDIFYIQNTSTIGGQELVIKNNIINRIKTSGLLTIITSDNTYGVKFLHNTISIDSCSNSKWINFGNNTSNNNHGYYNNIFIANNSVGYWFYQSVNFSSSISDNNVFYCLTTNFHFTNNFYNFNNWKTITNNDINSYYNADPKLLTPLKIYPSTTATFLDSGKVNTGVTSDYFGNNRSSTNPTIGAVEVFKSENDGPQITLNNATNTSSLNNRVLLQLAIVTDTSGLDTSLIKRPLLFYKKRKDINDFISNNSDVGGWKYVRATNNTSPFNFTIDYSLLKDKSVSPGEIIDYFIYAEDKLSNASVSSGVFSRTLGITNSFEDLFPISGVNTSYGITEIVPNVVHVGKNEKIKSLTNEGGLFQYLFYNNVVGPVTVIINSDLTEDGTFALSKINRVGNVRDWLTITTDKDTSYTISGNYNGALIRFEGADSVIFGSQFLRENKLKIVNNYNSTANNISAVIDIKTSLDEQYNSRYIKIQNLEIENKNSSAKSYGITSIDNIDSNLPGVSNIVVKNNIFTDNWIAIRFTSNSINLGENIEVIGNYFNSKHSFFSILIYNAKNTQLSANTFEVHKVGNKPPYSSGYKSSVISVSGNCPMMNIEKNNIRAYLNESYDYYYHSSIDIDVVSGGDINIVNNKVDIEFGFNAKLSNEVIALDVRETPGIKILHNTFSLKGFSKADNFGSLIVYRNGYPKNPVVLNNIFSNQTYGSSNKLYNYDEFNGSNPVAQEFDYNNFYTSSSNVPQFKIEDNKFKTLNELQSSTNFNKHSTEAYVYLDNQLYPQSSFLYKKGKYVPSVSTDYNNKQRINPPTIGAYEVEARNYDISVDKIINPDGVIKPNAIDSIMVVVSNKGSKIINNFTISAELIGIQNITLNRAYSKQLLPNTSDTVLIGNINSTNYTNGGSVKVYTTLMIDSTKSNDTLYSSFCYPNINSIHKLKSDTTEICSDYTLIKRINNIANEQIEWYDKPVAGSLVNVGETMNINVNRDTAFYVSYPKSFNEDTIISSNIVKTGYPGVMFKIQNTNSFDVDINDIFYTLNTFSTGNTYLKLYLKSGDFVGSENSLNNWTLLQEDTVWFYSSGLKTSSLRNSYRLGAGQTVSILLRFLSTSFTIASSIYTNAVPVHQRAGITIYGGAAKSNVGITSSTISNVKPHIGLSFTSVGQCYYHERTPIFINVKHGVKDVAIIPIQKPELEQRAGTKFNPDILCSNTISFKISNTSKYNDAEYGIKWRVIEKEVYIIKFNTTYIRNSDTNRTLNINNVSNESMYLVKYVIEDMVTNCQTYYERYFVKINPVTFDLGSNQSICAGDSIQLGVDKGPYVKYLWSTGDTTATIYAKDEGKYKLEVKYGTCLSFSDSIIIKHNVVADSVDFSFKRDSFCIYSFKADSLSNVIYSWNFGDGVSTSGMNVSHAYINSGTYKVSLTTSGSGDDCILKTKIEKLVNVECLVGLNPDENTFNLTLSPNPFDDKITLDFMLEKESNISVNVFNSIGQKIENIINDKSAVGKQSITWTNNYTSGIYFVELLIDGERIVRKVVK